MKKYLYAWKHVEGNFYLPVECKDVDTENIGEVIKQGLYFNTIADLTLLAQCEYHALGEFDTETGAIDSAVKVIGDFKELITKLLEVKSNGNIKA